MKLSDKLQSWIKSNPAPWKIGQLIIVPSDGTMKDTFDLFHEADLGKTDLQISSNYLDARKWVKTSEAGEYRPLKGENNLIRGWKLNRISFDSLKEVLNIFYPTSVANYFFHQDGALRITFPKSTFERQSGMYHIVKKASDEQVETVKKILCQKRCLKIRLWEGSQYQAIPSVIPLFCPEVCNLFIAGVRSEIKGKSELISEE